MRRVLVTGANKGIGLAIAEAILSKHEDTFVIIGSRDRQRGEAALASLSDKDAAWAKRASVLELDVSSDSSVASAAKAIGTDPLYGIVNNAGVGFGVGTLVDTFAVNTYGIRRVCEAFAPLLEPKGRIVNITSAAGPIFVFNCTQERRDFFLNPDLQWEELKAFMDSCVALDNDDDELLAQGLGGRNSYGLSKACANSYTTILARENPDLMISACTPGFIETDLTRTYAKVNNQSVEDMGMKSPAEGTKSALHALFEPLAQSGYYYGSDAKRSPMDRYRGPGDPEYTGT